MEPIAEVTQEEFLQEYLAEMMQKNSQLEQLLVQARLRVKKLEERLATYEGGDEAELEVVE